MLNERNQENYTEPKFKSSQANSLADYPKG